MKLGRYRGREVLGGIGEGKEYNQKIMYKKLIFFQKERKVRDEETSEQLAVITMQA